MISKERGPCHQLGQPSLCAFVAQHRVRSREGTWHPCPRALLLPCSAQRGQGSTVGFVVSCTREMLPFLVGCVIEITPKSAPQQQLQEEAADGQLRSPLCGLYELKLGQDEQDWGVQAVLMAS